MQYLILNIESFIMMSNHESIEEKKFKDLTPMMKHWFSIKQTYKEKYPSHLIAYRMGDFYEFFYDDAIRVSSLLGITLTKRKVGSDAYPLAGIPHHAGNYLNSTKAAAELIELVNSPFIKILYDVYHMQIMEGNITNTLKAYIDAIGYIHVADVPGRHEPGTGEINYPNVIKTLKELNYEGIIGFELAPLHDSKEAICRINKI